MFEKIVPDRFQRIIDPLKEVAGSHIWVSGGTLLAQRLGLPYYGDLDLLVGASPETVESALTVANLPVKRNLFGTLRCTTEDGGHVDISCNSLLSSSSQVEDALAKYHFSCVSSALNIATGELIRSKNNSRDLAQKLFSFETKYIRRRIDTIPNLKQISAYQSYFGLMPADNRTSEYFRRGRTAIDQYFGRYSAAELCDFATHEVRKFVPPNCPVLICRGYVRNAFRGQLGIWDDLDVLVLSSTEECEKHLRNTGVAFLPNYFGMPKLKTARGQKIDLICIGNRDPVAVLNSFAINLDRIAWDSAAQTLINEGKSTKCNMDEFVDVDKHALSDFPPQQRAYFLIKSAYFSVLYGCKISSRLASSLCLPCSISEFDMGNTQKLAIELLDRAPRENILGFLQQSAVCSGSSPIGVLAYFLKSAVSLQEARGLLIP